VVLWRQCHKFDVILVNPDHSLASLNAHFDGMDLLMEPEPEFGIITL
jgi:hypothetical protein